MEYRLLIAFEAIGILDGLPRNTRRNLLTQIGKLRFAPERLSDYIESDRVGRRVEVNVLSAVASTTGLILLINT